ANGGMSVGAAEDATVQQSGHLHVSAVQGAASYLIDSVVANGTGTDHRVLFLVAHEKGHSHGYSSPQAAARGMLPHGPQSVGLEGWLLRRSSVLHRAPRE